MIASCVVWSYECRFNFRMLLLESNENILKNTNYCCTILNTTIERMTKSSDLKDFIRWFDRCIWWRYAYNVCQQSMIRNTCERRNFVLKGSSDQVLVVLLDYSFIWAFYSFWLSIRMQWFLLYVIDNGAVKLFQHESNFFINLYNAIKCIPFSLTRW